MVRKRDDEAEMIVGGVINMYVCVRVHMGTMWKNVGKNELRIGKSSLYERIGEILGIEYISKVGY